VDESTSARDASGPALEPIPVRTVAPVDLVVVELEIVRAGSRRILRVEVPLGSPIRRALRAAGQAAEGSAVLEGDTPVPLDRPLAGPIHLVVIPTFSGG
jgi:hypothetical protein